MKIIRYVLLLFVFLSWFPHCSGVNQGGSEVGNPEPVSLSVIGYSESALKQLNIKRLQVNDIQVDTALIVLGRIELRPFPNCEDEVPGQGETRFEGPFVVDLLAQGSLSELEGVDIPRGTYCKLELRLEKLSTNVQGEETIFGNSVYLEGLRSDGVPFRIKLEEDEEFEIENETTGFEIDPAIGIDRFFVAFDLDTWFSGVDLFDPELEISMDMGGDPIILIDNDHNTDIREIIIDNIELSSDLFEDKNDNGELDEEEQRESLAEGQIIN